MLGDKSYMILVDTNIIIEAFKSNQDVIKKLNAIGLQNIVLSDVTVMELLFGARDKAELSRIKRYIKSLQLLSIDSFVSNQATKLIELYSKSHGLMIPDALIAATAMRFRMPLLTLNVKDFIYIVGLELSR